MSASGTGLSPTEKTMGKKRWTSGNSSTVTGTAWAPVRKGAFSMRRVFQSPCTPLESG
jgi:hypothetical protein